MKKILLLLCFFTISVSYAQVAADDFSITNEDTPIVIDVLLNDDPSFDPTSTGVLAPPSDGSVVVDPSTGQMTYIPNLDFNGGEIITYYVCTSSGTPVCDTADILITINPVNDMPVAADDNASTTQNTTVTLNILANDSDPNDPLGNIDNATLDLDASTPGVQNNYTSADGLFVTDGLGNLTFTPNASFIGSTTLNYTICDDGNPLPALCTTALVTIAVTASPNTPPVAGDDNAATLINTAVSIDILANDTDNSALDPTSVVLVSGAVNGITAVDPTTGQIVYTPNSNFIGTETITYTVCDDGQPNSVVLCSNTGTLTITVSALNVQGTIMSSSATPLQNSTVYLIEQNISSSGNLLFVSQTTTTDAAGFYQFYNVPQTFYIKAIPDQTLYPSDVPTYYLNSSVFQYATAISPTVSPFTANFNTAAGLNPGGVGFIAGFVGAGAGKNNAEGDPIADLEVVLVNASSVVVAHTTTDTQGNFEFSNLEIADYYVWVDNGSVDNANAPLISLGTENTQSDLKFVLEEEALEFRTVSSIQDLSQSEFKLYPNPSKGIVNLSSTELNSTYNVEIVNMLGEVVYSNKFETNNAKINMREEGLSKGTYLIKLIKENRTYFSKIVLN